MSILQTGRLFSLSWQNSTIWFIIFLLCIIDSLWIAASGIMIENFPFAILLLAFFLCIAFVFYRTGKNDCIMNIAHSLAQVIAFAMASVVFSYFLASLKFPLRDPLFHQIDVALGFNWASWSNWVETHGWIQYLFGIIYKSSSLQIIGCILYLGLRNSSTEFVLIFILSALITFFLSAFVPAIGYSLNKSFVPVILELHNGGLKTINLGHLQGIVAFPSYHTTMAIILTYPYRHTLSLFVPLCCINAIMVLSVLTEGGHYLIDIFPGILIALFSIWVVRFVK